MKVLLVNNLGETTESFPITPSLSQFCDRLDMRAISAPESADRPSRAAKQAAKERTASQFSNPFDGAIFDDLAVPVPASPMSASQSSGGATVIPVESTTAADNGDEYEKVALNSKKRRRTSTHAVITANSKQSGVLTWDQVSAEDCILDVQMSNCQTWLRFRCRTCRMKKSVWGMCRNKEFRIRVHRNDQIFELAEGYIGDKCLKFYRDHPDCITDDLKVCIERFQSTSETAVSHRPMNKMTSEYTVLYAYETLRECVQEELDFMNWPYLSSRVAGDPDPEFLYSITPFGTSHGCDICSTKIGMTYWTCIKCSLEVCRHCIAEWCDNTILRLCSHRIPHTQPDRLDPITVASEDGGLYMVTRFRPVIKCSLDRVRRMMKRLENIHTRIPSQPKQQPSQELKQVGGEPSLICQRFHIDEVGQVDFGKLWSRGEPFVISGLLDRLQCDWSPAAMLERNQGRRVMVLNNETGKQVLKADLRTFFAGFEDPARRLIGGVNATTQRLKLRDWPPDTEFETMFKDLHDDFMNALPFGEHTTKSGSLNLASYMSADFNPSDLGPKMYNAYESEDGSCATPVHLDMADAVNMMVYSTKHPLFDMQPASALWDIYPAECTQRLSEALGDRLTERGKSFQHPIHDISYSISSADRHYLASLPTPIYSYRIFQNPGDAVFIPAGCAHQVRNLKPSCKIAVDFVSPERTEECWRLMRCLRQLPKGHWRRADVLQIRTMLLCVASQLVECD